MAKELHPKILELKATAAPINYRALAISDAGVLIDNKRFLEERILAGYGCIYGRKNKHDEIVVRGAHDKSIRERGPGSTGHYQIKMFGMNHDHDEPLAQFTVLESRELGLYFETEPLDENDAEAMRVLNKIRKGLINNYSTGWDYVWDKMEYDEKQNAILLKEQELYEISPVGIPSDTGTFTIRSAEEAADLYDEAEYFIKQIPRRWQMQARQLFARHKALAGIKPLGNDEPALNERQAADVQPGKRKINYDFLTKNFDLK